MTQAFLEHANITVSNPQETARLLCDIFDWKIRWHGEAINGGVSYHVGSDTHYLAIYSNDRTRKSDAISYDTIGSLNHIGIVVENLEEIHTKIVAKGFETFSHADYEPGRRFYFCDNDNIEFEIISYT